MPATSEIKVGDNDNFSVLVAILCRADQRILLSDQESLYTADPRQDPDSKLIREVNVIDDDLRKLAGESLLAKCITKIGEQHFFEEIESRYAMKTEIA